MKYFFLLFIAFAGCSRIEMSDPLVAIQIQDRNGLTETISAPDRLEPYKRTDFFSSQPYKKVLRIYKNEEKNRAKISTYHPNGAIWQYLEIEEMRAHGAYREWHPNGQLKIEATVIGGTADVAQGAQRDWLFEGMSQVWDEQGRLVAKIPYEKGIMGGTSLYFFPSGQLEKELPYLANALEGIAVEYFPNGKIKSRTAYQRGIKQGQSSGYFANDRSAWIEEYNDGRLLKGSYFSPEGELLSEVEDGWGFQASFEGDVIALLIEIQSGEPEGIVKRFAPNRELLGVHYVKNGMKHGEEIEYYLSSEKETASKDPLPKISIQWHQDMIHGSVKSWYKNGQLQNQREYSRNQLMGPSCAWYRNGSLMYVEEYEENRLMRGQYYKIHHKNAVSTIANGNGVATLYDEEGIFLRKVSYAKGKPIDPED